jgi:hypothetical protein
MLSEDFLKVVGKFPAMFAKAVVFGEHPSRERPSKLIKAVTSMWTLLRADTRAKPGCGPLVVYQLLNSLIIMAQSHCCGWTVVRLQ